MKDLLLVALAIVGLASVSQAKPKPASVTPAPAPEAVVDVEELSITAQATCLAPKPDSFATRPKIVSTFPANGAMVRPGVLVLRITFDQPMSCKGFFTGIPRLRNPCPLEHQQWVLSFDRKTIRTVCRADGVGAYGVGVSDNPDATFLSLAGRPLDPYEFRFTTSAAPDVLTAGESLDQDPDSPPRQPEFVPLDLQTAHVRK